MIPTPPHPDPARAMASSRFAWVRFLACLVALGAVPRLSAFEPVSWHPNPPHQSSNIPAIAELTWATDRIRLLANGGFEAGTGSGWTLSATGNGGYVVNNGLLDPQGPEVPTPPLEGNFSLVTEPQSPGAFVASQVVAIPRDAERVILRWSDRIRNQEPSGLFSDNPQTFHNFRVELREPASDNILAVLFSTEPGDQALADWTKRAVDLTSFRGRTVRVAFATYVSLFFFNVHLDNISVTADLVDGASHDVYFGKQAALSAADFMGTTTNTQWALPPLDAGTTYYWRVETRIGSESVASPLWRFETGPAGPLDHFTWNPLPSPARAGIPFQATITARDHFENLLTNFNGVAQITPGLLRSAPPPVPSTSLLGRPEPTATVVFDGETVGYSFTPNGDWWIAGLWSYSAEVVSLWTEAGTLIARVSGPRPGALWTYWPLAEAVPLQGGRTYRLGSFSRGEAAQFARFDLPDVVPQAAIHRSFTGAGHGRPTVPHPAQWWLVDLEGLTGPSEPLAGASPWLVHFSQGVWTGPLLLPSADGRVTLRVQSASGASGLANLIEVLSSPENDTDGDGMPDAWESAHGLDAMDPGDAGLDLDGDGFDNLEEYQAGTDPRDPASALRILSLRQDNGRVTLRFEAVQGRAYALLTRNSLSTGGWSRLAEVGGATVDGPLEVSDPDPIAGTRFYRIVTPPPP